MESVGIDQNMFANFVLFLTACKIIVPFLSASKQEYIVKQNQRNALFSPMINGVVFFINVAVGTKPANQCGTNGAIPECG